MGNSFKLHYMKCEEPSLNCQVDSISAEPSSYCGIALLPGDLVSVGIFDGHWLAVLGMRHIGVYIGTIEGKAAVIHFTDDGIRLDTLGKGWEMSPRLEYRPSRVECAKEAIHRLKANREGNYDLLKNNCNAFVKRCLGEETAEYKASQSKSITNPHHQGQESS